MGYKKNKSKIFIAIVFFILAASLLMTTGFLFIKTDKESDKLNAIKKEVATFAEAKTNLQGQVDELKIKNDQTTKQMEELKLQLENLKKEYPQIKVDESKDDQKYAYLTFDDGPSENTVKILDFLKANNIRATFFVLGKQDSGELYRRIVKEGHTLAVHSNTHEYKDIYKNVDTFIKDIEAVADLVKKETGVQPNILRFPGGSNNTVSHKYGGKDIMNKIIPQIEKEGYTYFDWNVDSLDAAKGLQDKNVIVNSVLQGAKYTPHPVILMHDAAAKTTTVQALPEIVQGLKNQGFMFKPLTADVPEVKFLKK